MVLTFFYDLCACGVLSHVQLFVTQWTVAYQAPVTMGFSRPEYWSGVPFPTPGALPNPGIEPVSLMSPALAGGFFTTRATTVETTPDVNNSLTGKASSHHYLTSIRKAREAWELQLCQTSTACKIKLFWNQLIESNFKTNNFLAHQENHRYWFSYIYKFLYMCVCNCFVKNHYCLRKYCLNLLKREEQTHSMYKISIKV